MRAEGTQVPGGPQKSAGLGRVHQIPHPPRRVVGHGLVAGPHEQPAQRPRPGRFGDRPLRRQFRGQPPGVGLVCPGRVPYPAPDGQRPQQAGHVRVLRVELDPELQGIPRRPFELLGGVDGPACRALADAGYGHQPVRARPEHVGDRADAVRRQLVEPGPTVHSVLDRLDRHLPDRGPHLRLARDRVRLDDRRTA
jgi:hypothetical protein